jgi:hypothetical protein
MAGFYKRVLRKTRSVGVRAAAGGRQHTSAADRLGLRQLAG